MPFAIQSALSACGSFVDKLSLTYHCGLLRGGLMSLRQPPKAMRSLPVALWEGNAQHGYAILSGFLLLSDEGGVAFQKSWTTPEEFFADAPYLATYLHRFEALKDLKATGDMSARRLARRLVEHWSYNNLSRKSARLLRRDYVFVASLRLSNFILFYDFFGASATTEFRKTFFKGLRQEYLALKRHLPERKRASVEERLALLKALLAYNVYVEEDAAFVTLLLKELNGLQARLEEALARREGTVARFFRAFCDLVDLRNTLLQNKPDFLNRYPYYHRVYTRALRDLTDSLQKMVPFLRFHRHSCGTLCQMEGQRGKANPVQNPSDFFFEAIPVTLIDTALSQVEANPNLPAWEDGEILRLSGKRSVLFVNRSEGFESWKSPFKVKGYGQNLLPKTMNLEWSNQSYSVVQSSTVVLLPQRREEEEKAAEEKTPAHEVSERMAHLRSRSDHLAEEQVFEGLLLADDQQFAFKRTVRLPSEENTLSGVDELLWREEEGNALALEVFTLGPEWALERLLHEPQATYGEATFHLAGTLGKNSVKRKRNKVLCCFILESEASFSLKVLPPVGEGGGVSLRGIFLLKDGELCKINWKFEILKE